MELSQAEQEQKKGDNSTGGGIRLDSTTELIMNGGNICGNIATNSGAGIYANGAKVTLNNSNISYNYGSSTGGIYLCANSSLEMNDSVISYNISDSTNGAGGLFSAKSTVVINNGTIIDNTSKGFAGGIYSQENLTLQGKVIIKENSNTGLEKDSVTLWPQNLATSEEITVNELIDGSEINIAIVNLSSGHSTGDLTSEFQTNNPGVYYGDFFTYDGPEKFYMTLNAAGELEIKQKDPENYLITILRSENGTALADKTETGKDDEVTLNAIPKSGYMLEEFIVIDADSNPITVEDGKFVMPEKNVFITATFKEAPKSSGTKKYKADDKETAEKISGSGKKGSTRTITPIEGKKVASVVVTDKDGNKIDVTVNEDGTYSFKQPASDVNIEVTYKNREITLNIGSTEASVDGERENLDVSPVIRNDRTMLPIRFVAENLGAKVGWDEKNPNIVTISRGDTEIVIHLGSEKMLVNGKEVILDSVAFAENDRTYLPVRAISEALNAIVEWNEERPMEVKIYER